VPTYVALLRGVNVGKAKRLAMADFRALLGALGYTDVKTLLNSGNAVFRAPGRSAGKIASDVAAAIAEELGLDVPVVVKTAAELEAAARECTLAKKAKDPSRLLVAFTQDAAALRPLRRLTDLAGPGEELVVGKNAAFLHVPAGILKSRIGEALLGKAGPGVTTRNWATVQKLLELTAGMA
jgi:uncharacterized protein (DUF1697 family)